MQIHAHRDIHTQCIQIHTDIQMHSPTETHRDTFTHIETCTQIRSCTGIYSHTQCTHTNAHRYTQMHMQRHVLIRTWFELFCSQLHGIVVLLSTSRGFPGLPRPCSVGGEDPGGSTRAVRQAALRVNSGCATDPLGDCGQVTFPPGSALVSLSSKWEYTNCQKKPGLF